MHVNKKIALLLILISFKTVYAQNIDSLKKVFYGISNPSEKCKWIIELGYDYYHKNETITFLLNQYADSLCNIFLKSASLPDSTSLLEQKANALNNLAFLNLNKGKIEEALNFYFKSLKIRESINDYAGMATSYNSIGSIYNNQGDFEKAKEFFEKSLAMRKILGKPKGIAYSLNNLGCLYEQKKEVLTARKYYLESKTYIEQTEDSSGIASVYNNIGWSYQQTKNYDSALYYYSKSKEIGELIGDKTIITFALSNSGKVFYEIKQLDKGEAYTNKALKIAQEQGFPETIRNAASILSEIYAAKGNYKNAYEMHVLYKKMADSLRNKETEKKLLTEKLLYDFEKQKTLLTAENEKALLIAASENKQKNIILLFTSLGGFSLIAFSWILYQRLKITRKQNKIIEEQKKLLEHKNAIVEEKNKDITDSINYAKRIQDALLQNQNHISEHLPEHFILFLPRDIVSGDFYWALEKNDYLYFAVADCTGHGVPGAFMSLLGITFLNEICKNNQIQSPAEILEALRDKIINQLHQKDDLQTSFDGMDIALCRLNLKTNELLYAGANNPCWIVNRNNGKLTELHPDKQPVGIYTKPTPFNNHELILQKGDCIYLFSDGFADQFGGSKGKKMKTTLLRQKIKEASHLSAKEQKRYLKEFFISWKGQYEQIDDVCLLGLIA